MVYLQRHGESETNIRGIFSCRELDPDLTERGMQQAEERAGFYKDKGINRIVSSPMKRARQTAEAVCGVVGLGYEVDDDLYEVDIGFLEGKSEHEDAWKRLFYGTVEAWLRGENLRYNGGECLADVRDRIERVKARYAVDGAVNTVLVGHSTFFAMIIHTLTKETDVKKLFLPRCGYFAVTKW